MVKTISHSENNKGWNSFWSYVPDLMTRLNNRFVSVKNGQLWLHNDTENPTVNNFYGVQYGTSIKTIFNDAMAEDKIFKTIALESDQKWQVDLKTNLTNSTINPNEFNTRDSRQFSFIRGNENASSLRGNSAQGIGTISSIVANVVSFVQVPILVSVGDILTQLNGSNKETIGVIISIDLEINTITLGTIVTVPTVGFYAFSLKNSRVEGEEVRGYFLEIECSNNQPSRGELFAVATNVVKSYV